MGVTVRGLGAVISGISRKAKNGKKAGEEELDRQAVLLAREARAYAPYKKGHLQSAASIYALKGKRSGIVYRVEVKMGGRGGKADAYIEKIHEQIGWKNLGPGSIQKAQATGKPVGAFFLDRAAKDMENEIRAAVSQAIKRGTK